MRVASKIFKIMIWITALFYAIVQGMAAVSLALSNANAVADGSGKPYNIIPVVCIAVIILISAILYSVLKKRKYLGISLAFIAAIGMLFVGLDLGRRFPVTISSTGAEVGLSTGKMIWRHYGIAIVPILMLIGWKLENLADKAEIKESKDLETNKDSSYDLSCEAVFKDDERTKKSEKSKK